MEPIRENSIRTRSYQTQDGMFPMADYQQELREHYARAMENQEWQLAFDVLKTMVSLQFPSVQSV